MKKLSDGLLKDPRILFNEQTIDPEYPTNITTEDRIKGALMGTLIGDALGQGCLWYYDYNDLWKQYGTWVDNYVDPQKDGAETQMAKIAEYKYAAGVRAGFSSQTGQLIQVLLETIVADIDKKGPHAQGEFVGSHYTETINKFFEEELLPRASFEVADKDEPNTFFGNGIQCYSGRYTNREVRENFDIWYNNGQKNGKWWEDPITSVTSTSDGAQMGVVLAALYRDPVELFNKAYEMLRMWYSDPAFISQALDYLLVLQAIINGVALKDMKNYLADIVYDMGEIGKRMSSFDDLSSGAKMITMVAKPQLFNFDDRFAPMIFGSNCHIFHLLPCAYYYSYKYNHEFERPVLIAVNSGGNNMARAALTGALSGAMNGIQAIPQRFIDGLATEERLLHENYSSHAAYLMALAEKVAKGSNGIINPYQAKDGEDCGCLI
ncbi:MAG: ADP-ribosylglycohydrolase family protein [Clostridiales bacterium]